MNSQRGYVLGAVTIAAVMFSIASYVAIMIALSQARQAQFSVDRAQARFAAEAGIVWGMQQLWLDPTWSDPAGDVDLTVNARNIDVIMPVCTLSPCERRTLSAQVVY